MMQGGRVAIPHLVVVKRTRQQDDITYSSVDEDHGSHSTTTTEKTTPGATGDDTVNELQALNTALCFLCSINADIAEVDSFLTAHPQALLFEETGTLSEESAHYIVKQQMQRCDCFSPICKENRKLVLTSLNFGFEHFHTQSMIRGASRSDSRYIRSEYLQELMIVERGIRDLRLEELMLRNRLMETAVEIRSFQRELDDVLRKCGEYQNKSVLALLAACTRSSEIFARRTILQYRLDVATHNMVSVGQEHAAILHQIRQGRFVQFAVLKQAFHDCRRHLCAPSTSSTRARQIQASMSEQTTKNSRRGDTAPPVLLSRPRKVQTSRRD